MNGMIRKTGSIAIAIGLAAGAATALAQGGPGMMGGGGPGYGQGGGRGYGPGMMGGGPGYGFERGYGPRGGFGPGATYLDSLNLTDEQRDKIQSIQEDNRQKNWATMGQVRAEMFKLRRMMYADNVDATAVTEQQKKVDELRRQTLKSRLEAHNQVESVLTPEQRKQFRQYRPWWLQESEQ